jgi:hypothetical protein
MSTRHLESSYVSAYQLAHNKFPKEFRHIGGKFFMVDGQKRDRRWLMQEVVHLQKLAQENVNRAPSRQFRIPFLRFFRRLAGAK